MYQRLLLLAVVGGGLPLFCDAGRGSEGKDATGVEKLIADLSSEDGQKRAAATKELFRRGKAVLADMKKAGAGQIAPVGTIDSRRLDVVYSVIDGLPAGNYRPDSFGLRLEKGATRELAAAVCGRHGCTLAGTFNADGVPNVYVRVGNGKALPDVLRAILSAEPKVVSVNLNYFER
jgi:hypothetical protein